MSTPHREEHEHEHTGQHLVHSHAHEEELPGTVNLTATEGDDTGYGQALFPVPALDPNDPLQWPNWKKTIILVICSLYSFMGNAALTGISPYIQLLAVAFDVTPTEASTLISYPNLAFGFSSLIWVPLYLKIGRRPVILLTMLMFIAGLIGTSQATTFNGLMAARCIHSFGAGICEAIPVQMVNDIFFIHERGKRIGYYTAALCLASITPLAAGYMLNGGYSWRLYFYVCMAFAIAIFILAFLFIEETSYDRKAAIAAESALSELPSPTEKGATADQNETVVQTNSNSELIPERRTYMQTLSLTGHVDHDIPFFMTMVRSFTYFLVPQPLWVITTYGIYIGLGAFVISFTFPIKIMQPPYNWDVTSSGLFSLAASLGFLLALPFSSSSDRLAAYYTRKNNGVREAEMRLGVLLVPMLLGPAALILYGMAADQNLHWIAYFISGAFLGWSGYFFFSFTIAYAVDSYFANTSEMLIAINIGKQAISFGFGDAVIDWVNERGYAVVIAGIFTTVLAVNNLTLIVFMIWGKNIRRAMHRSWLGRLHQGSASTAMTH